MNYKWLTFNSITAFIIAFSIQYYDAFNLLWTMDRTHVTLIILGIYGACTAYLGYAGDKANFEAVNFHAARLPHLGLIGTVTAIMLMLFGIHDVEQFRQHIVVEVAPVFITALFGIGLSYLLNYQVAICFNQYEVE